MKAAPAAPNSHGLAGMDDRIGGTSASEPLVTSPRSAQDDVTEGLDTQEDWLPLATADPAFGSKKPIAGKVPYEEGVAKTRILVAFENEFRVFRDAIAGAIRIHRPRVEVAAVELDVLGDKVTHFDPHLVICSQPNTVDPNGRPAWFKLPPDPDRLAEICLDGQRAETSNPALKELLRVVDETARLARTKRELGNC